MKKLFLALLMLAAVCPLLACGQKTKKTEAVGGKTLIVYFSWGGNTKQVAENIANHTGGTLFRIETVVPYPTEYGPCTEVARTERDNNIRPELKAVVENLDQYDTIFIGCPVWWHTAPMAVRSFLENEIYDFSGKTIIPFCTYEATFRDETLANIVELTPNSKHLKGFGTTNKNADVQGWLKEIGVTK